MCLKENLFWRNDVSKSKKGYWKGCVIARERLETNYCQIQGWKIFVHVFIWHQTSFWGKQNIEHEIRCAAILLKSNNLNKVYFSLMEINWHVLQIANSHFRYTIWCMIFERKYHEGHVCSRWCSHAPKVSTSYSHICRKICALEFPIFPAFQLIIWGLVVFTDMNRYIVKESRNFKTLLKENYAVALDTC